MAEFVRARPDGIDLFVRLVPRSAVDRLDGTETAPDGKQHLKARVRAVPEKGKANAALEALLADALEVRRSAVGVIAGATARLKTVHVAGDPAGLAERCTTIVQTARAAS